MMRPTGKQWRRLVSAVALWCVGGGLAPVTEAATEVTAISTENAPEGATATSASGNHTLTVGGNWTLADGYRIGAKILGQLSPTGDTNYKTVLSNGSVFNSGNWDLTLVGAATGGSMMMNGVTVTGASIDGGNIKIYGAIPYESLIGGTPSTSSVAISTNSVTISGASMNLTGTCEIYGERGVGGVDNGSVTISDTAFSSKDVDTTVPIKIGGAFCEQGNIINSRVDISKSALDARYNSVSIYGAKFSGRTAPENTLLKGNSVKLTDSKLTLDKPYCLSSLYVYAADFCASPDSYNIVAGTEASGNSVTITGADGNYGQLQFLELYGVFGSSLSAMTGNGVNISGGVFNVGYAGYIYGAFSYSDKTVMSNNYVAISGGDFSGSPFEVAASSRGAASSANPNAVYLSGSLKGIEGMSLLGGTGTQTGSLYVGALRSDDGPKLADPLAATDVNGTLTNKFSSLKNFNNVYIYGLDPSANAPVLSAKSFSTESPAILHLENMNLETLPAPGKQLTLLQMDNPFIGTESGVVKVYNAVDDQVKIHTLKSDTTTQWVYDAPDKKTLTDVVLEATGKAEIIADPAKNTISLLRYGTSDVLNTVRILGATGAGDKVPDGWTTPVSGPVIDTSTMTLPTDMPPGEARNILTASNNFFGAYRITREHAYTEQKGGEADYTDGVRFSSWVEKKGVRVVDDKNGNKDNVIEYLAPRKTVTDIALGEAQWGKPRTASTDYEFSGKSQSSSGLTINASDLTLAVGNDYAAKLAADVSTPLLTDATDLTAGLSVVGADRSQSVGWTADNGAALTATMTGTVSTEKDEIRYTVKSIVPTGVDLSGWDGTTNDTGYAVPQGWQNAADVPVNAESIAAAPGSLLGETTILTAKEGFFDDDKITGSYKYADKVSFNHEKNGVTLTGKWSRGVQTAEGGAKLVFVNGDLESSNVTLGQMEWNQPRELKGNCDFTGATVDASALTFTGLDAATKATDTPLLLTGAKNLPAATISHTQSFAASTGNDVKLSATMTGGVVATSTGIDYRVDTIALDSVDLSGWNSAASTAKIEETWTANPAGVAVNADGIDAAPEKLLGETTILTAQDGFFSDVNISGANKYGERKEFSHEDSGVTLSGTWSRGVKAAEGGAKLIFVNGKLESNNVTLGNMTWGTSRDLTGELDCDFSNAKVSAADLVFTVRNDDAAKLAAGSSTPLLTGAKGLKANLSVDGANRSQTVDWTAGNKAVLTATMTGTVSTEAETVKYTVGGITLDSVNLAGWDGVNAAAVPTKWEANPSGVAVTTEGFTVHPQDMKSHSIPILSASNPIFSDEYITGAQAFRNDKSFRSERDGVALSGIWSHGVKASGDGTALLFEGGDVSVNAITVGEIQWKDGAVLRTAKAEAFDYTKAVFDVSGFSVANPTEVGIGQSMTLLAANDTLADFSEQTKAAYSYSPAEGVSLSGALSGTISSTKGTLALKTSDNRATNLSFGTVAWKESGALMARPDNISLDGTTVDTSAVAFTGVDMLHAGDVTELVAGFDGTPGKVVGDSYRLGTAIGGAGHASLSDDALLYTIETVGAAPETHALVMGTGAGMALLSSGNSFIDSAAEGLSLASNTGADGVSTFARMGGGSLRQETGSHADLHTWNAVLALGYVNEKPKGTTEYGAFFEYGTGNYTTHDGDRRGDGSMHYTGGGVLAKWKNPGGFYIEGSLRAGTICDDAHSVMRDAAGTPYSYKTDAGYWGAHLGVGREISLSDGNILDVYGKYFFTRKDGVSFDAGDHFDLDAATSQVLSVGARYTMKRENWNFYGGLAYEHELDGQATGRAKGFAIRGADIGGGSVRMELGATMKPDAKSPWSLDLNLSGFAGKKQGVTGGISASFNF